MMVVLEEEKEKWMTMVKEDIMRNINDIIAQANRAQTVEDAMKTKADLDEAAGKLETKMKETMVGPGSEDKRRKEAFTAKRGFSNVPTYNGKHEDYDDWKFHMGAFLGEDIQMDSLLRKMGEIKTIPDEAAVIKVFEAVSAEVPDLVDPIWINHQLYQVLCLNLRGKALTTIKALKDDELKDINGVVGWCKLAQEVSAMTAQRLQGLADKVYAPKRCKKFSEVSHAIEEWEINAKLFEKTEDFKLSGQTRIYSIRQLVPEELERDIIKATTLTDIDKVENYIAEQVSVRKDVKNESKGPVQMEAFSKTLATLMEGNEGEEDNYGDESYLCKETNENDENTSVMEQLLSFMKGHKGGGKGGKGKGFEGTCHHCGLYGHRIAQCFKKDQDMKGKGKGKDGSYGNYDQSKGKGKGYGPSKGYGYDGKNGKGNGYEAKGGNSWTGGGKGSIYGFGNYDEAVRQSA